jgi:transcriptional regulator with XRE-family HTH domain
MTGSRTIEGRIQVWFAYTAQQLRTEKGLTQREVAQRGKSPLVLIQRIEDNTLQNITHYAFYRLGYGLRLKALSEVAELLQRVEESQKLPIAENHCRKRRSMINPKTWETITGFTVNVKAAVERLNKLAAHFPENTQQLTEAAARIEDERDSVMKSLLAEAFARVEAKLGGSGGGPPSGVDRTCTPLASPRLVEQGISAATRGNATQTERAVVVIGEATGKRIRQLSLEEPYAKSEEIYLTIEFDDQKEILIDVGSRLLFGIKHLARDSDGELEPVKESPQRSIRALVKQLDERVRRKGEPEGAVGK